MLLEIDKNEKFWGGHIHQGIDMPFKNGFNTDLHYTMGNQTNYLLLSNKGRVIYSDEPFSFEINNNILKIVGDSDIFNKKVGVTLKDAYLFSINKLYNKKSGNINNEMFKFPQFNTWIELIYNQNQKDILKYAESIVNESYTPGVLMIDDNWQTDYGTWSFSKDRFDNPKGMMDKLHSLGFKVMLWVCPFISPDSFTFRKIEKEGLLVKNKDNSTYICKWWNGYSAVLDLSNPNSIKWFKNELNKLKEDYNVDGFKFDAGSPDDYPSDCLYFEKDCYGFKQAQKYSEFASFFDLSELRETCNQPQLAVGQRLCDKNHSWIDNGLNTLIPNTIAQSLMGYQYICPDMIGGGEFENMTANSEKLDEELFVRYAQASALLPMMQFSAAPWRVLSKEYSKYCLDAAKLHIKFNDYILNVIKESQVTMEPVIRSLEYSYPNSNYENINNEFLLGDKLLVAPITIKGIKKMDVILPEGKWQSDDGKDYEGNQTITIDTPIYRLPYFIKK